MILGRVSFPGTKCFQGGTRWKYRAHKWYEIRESLGTAAIEQQLTDNIRFYIAIEEFPNKKARKVTE